MKTGDHVWYNIGNGYNRKDDKIGHYVHKHEDKDVVQTVEGGFVTVAYREPSDPNNTDPSNRGFTWWKV